MSETAAAYEWSGSRVSLRISVDPVLFTLLSGRLHVLLRKRTWEPFSGVWALPGAINPGGEQIEETMWQELRALGFPPEVWVEQLKTFDRPPYERGGIIMPGRDPRGRVISVAYFATVRPHERPRIPAGRETEVAWWPLDGLPELAFDHADIVDYAQQRLRNKIQYAPVAFELLPPEFTLTDLQEVYEAVLGTRLDKRNFRRKVLGDRVLAATERLSRREKRPARLYRFKDCHFAYSPRALNAVSPASMPEELGVLAPA
ncbi:MAG TPA: NUDIX hydrolase [Chloroflexota bacterium]|jgi:8-oxo-dGTP diphosphatase|nr:NUDIX hydrolase [Chloroflexota bacterium]